MPKEIFQCRECGYCCQGETTVSLTPEDVARMADYLKISVAELKSRYLREKDKVIQMRVVDGHCIFYNGGCTVHPGKPWRCTQWPLHPSILSDPNNFETIKESCPGISKRMGYEEFCKRLAKLTPKKS
ncbi:MAG: YkgJ family cysteine cluster protein [Desulfobacteraceae bacterium]|nr:YkgJ family cysteine cluster protein [Desulfobacteraceae bacterium]